MQNIYDAFPLRTIKVKNEQYKKTMDGTRNCKIYKDEKQNVS